MSYAGDKSPQECWSVLATDVDAQLVDVRTIAEWNYTGIPSLETIGKEVILVEWQQFPSMQVNGRFVEAVTRVLADKGLGKSAPVFSICRSGVRSIASAQALTSAGFENAYNVLDGFEGPLDEHDHRSNVAGWKHAGFPWKQG